MMNASKDGCSSSSVTQLWHSNGKCPKRTIPIRRTKKEDVLRAGSFRSYGKKKKKSTSVAQPKSIYVELDVSRRYEVDPELYGDTNTRFFIYWTSDGFQRKGCFNLECSGFIQLSNKIALGATMSPTSIIYGSLHDITIIILKVFLIVNYCFRPCDLLKITISIH
ncbi:putative neprosin [Helianthus debilis subsp. tardiflorus]